MVLICVLYNLGNNRQRKYTKHIIKTVPNLYYPTSEYNNTSNIKCKKEDGKRQ